VLLGASTASADSARGVIGVTSVGSATRHQRSLDRDAGGLIVGIPRGGARGIETATPARWPGSVTLVLPLDEPDVAEAFGAESHTRDARGTRRLAARDSPFGCVEGDAHPDRPDTGRARPSAASAHAA
jgi:hypothetical protein